MLPPPGAGGGFESEMTVATPHTNVAPMSASSPSDGSNTAKAALPADTFCAPTTAGIAATIIQMLVSAATYTPQHGIADAIIGAEQKSKAALVWRHPRAVSPLMRSNQCVHRPHARIRS